MKYHLPQLEEARARGQAVTSEMEVFFQLCPCKIYAVTGSDGKTTTTSIIAELLKAQGKTVHLGGNIGKPLLPEIETIAPEDVAVVELSSFQLISMRESPDVAVVTNLSPNHLDVHKDMQEYIDAKKNILLHQGAFSRTVLKRRQRDHRLLRPGGPGGLLDVPPGRPGGTGVFGAMGRASTSRGKSSWRSRRSRSPAGTTWRTTWRPSPRCGGDVEPQTIRQVAETFAGVEHRAEFVRELGGVKYYNDSIATSPTRVISGMLSLFPQKIVMIAGGYDKHIPLRAPGPGGVR